MLKLKLQYLGHLMWRADSLKKTLMLGKIEGRRSRGGQRMRWLDDITTEGCNGHEFEQAPGDGEGQRSLACCSPPDWKEMDPTEQLNNNMSTKIFVYLRKWWLLVFDLPIREPRWRFGASWRDVGYHFREDFLTVQDFLFLQIISALREPKCQ